MQRSVRLRRSALLVLAIGLGAGCGGAGPDAVAHAGPACRVGATAPGEVVWIGDSYPAAGNGGIPRYTEQAARAAGSLAPGAAWRRYYVSGTRMANGQIPAQYAAAHVADARISTVVMNGGGNDILGSRARCLAEPPPPGTSCIAAVAGDIASAVRALLAKMQADGVTNVIYYFYPRTPSGDSGALVDEAFPIVKAACDAYRAPLHCRFVDTRPPFEGQAWLPDGIHPNDAGQQAIAALIWREMVAHCIAR